MFGLLTVNYLISYKPIKINFTKLLFHFWGIRYMEYETYQKGDYQVITFNKALVLTSNIDELDTIVSEFIEKNILKIAIHFKDGSYLSSRTGAAFIRCWETLKDYNGELLFINVNQDILDFLSVIDLDSVIKTYNSEEELEAVNK